MGAMRRVLVVGGGFAGLCCGRDLANHFLVTIVDAKEFFEYTPGVLRAYTKPKHLDALTFTLQPVIEAKMGCKYIWGEVTNLNGENRPCTIKPMFTDSEETIDFDYCIIASGCNFGPFHKWGESLWFPTIHRNGRAEGSWPHLDERFLEGRRRHILEEYGTLQTLNQKEATVLIVGAGFIGVEWVTELQYFFPKLKLTIIDGLDQCLGAEGDHRGLQGERVSLQLHWARDLALRASHPCPSLGWWPSFRILIVVFPLLSSPPLVMIDVGLSRASTRDHLNMCWSRFRRPVV